MAACRAGLVASPRATGRGEATGHTRRIATTARLANSLCSLAHLGTTSRTFRVPGLRGDGRWLAARPALMAGDAWPGDLPAVRRKVTTSGVGALAHGGDDVLQLFHVEWLGEDADPCVGEEAAL